MRRKMRQKLKGREGRWAITVQYTDADFFFLIFLSKTSLLQNSSIHTFIFFQDLHPTQAREDEEEEAKPPRSHGRKPK